MTAKYKVGDWVSFYRSGNIMYSKVEYISKTITGYYEYSTMHGLVRENCILEAR